MPDERGIAVVGALPIEQRLLRVAAEASRVELADHLVPSRAGVALVTTTTGLNRTHSMRSISSSRTTFHGAAGTIKIMQQRRQHSNK